MSTRHGAVDCTRENWRRSDLPGERESVWICSAHGGRLIRVEGASGWPQMYLCPTMRVLADVAAEREHQYATYGTNEDTKDGTGDRVPWLLPFDQREALVIQQAFRADYEQVEIVEGEVTWMHLVREEIAEAFQESDPERLRAELVQVAALAVSWIEKLDGRA